MILTIAGYLSALGFLAWILGSFFDYTGVAVIGGVIVVGIGAAAMTDGLQHETGQIETNVSENETEVTTQYDDVETPANFPLGPVIMILGAMMVIRALDEVAKS